MHGIGRIRAGIGLHAVVNVVFGFAAVATAAAGSAQAGGASSVALHEVQFPLGGAPLAVTSRAMVHVDAAVPPTTAPPVTAPATAPTTTDPAPALSSPEVELTAGHPDVLTRRVSSTGYCDRGTTASGEQAGPGGVAMNGVPMGSRWMIHEGPLAGTVLTVNDRIGHSSDFDIWFDTCEAALLYGRHPITVQQLD